MTARTDVAPHIETLPARAGETVDWPAWVPPPLREALAVPAPWRHQAEAAALAHAGTHTVIATGTASGKSLAYHLPVLTALLTDRRATALYVAPTKALGADQLHLLTSLDLPGFRAAGYDGDTPRAEREWVRRHARLVLTNPNMLHRGILPAHGAWATFLRHLRYVVLDECHAYRGVFGSHVAHVVRRLRRRARTVPTFILASATTGDPARAAARLIGAPVTAVTRDASPRGRTTFALCEPPLLPGAAPPETPRPPGSVLPRPSGSAPLGSSGSALPRPPGLAQPGGSGAVPLPAGDDGRGDLRPVRRSAVAETADLLADAVVAGVRTLAFVRSRRGAEVVASMARRSADEAVPGLGAQIAAYRSGYLPEDRRRLERQLREGTLTGLASTNALELGIDVSGLDAVLICGYPGTRASVWQQAGRAGRRGADATAVLVARDDPLDSYLVHHPQALFGAPVEATVLDPDNPYVLGPQLCCAAAESPLTPADLELFGGAPARAAADGLVASGALRRRPHGLYWTHTGRPDVDLRGPGGPAVSVVERDTGRLLGSVDAAAAHHQVHPGAVHLHQGETYVVDSLDLDDGVALVTAEEPAWTTHARDTTALSVVGVRRYRDAGSVGLFLGDVEVTHQVVSYQRRRLGSGEVMDTRPLDLPPRQLRTVAVWYTVSAGALAAAGVDPADVPGALHAAEHAAIGLLPLVATCDRWDIGGLSTAAHPDTAAPTVFVYDGHPGGAGFAERAYEAAATWLDATRTAVAQCGCATGCPSCVQSPKCGNGNQPLAKRAAVAVLDVVLAALCGPSPEARPGA
ncbi:DEAD/DEAH box helicase [Pilimelia terevasa]|uniref:DEAD/DEAH box helicase n=1 Tax=Pilimelia terevasa TaxID=53372 RepID=A0A8J3FG46_9ACTN|nr:DEAD/DEAH box helicase [Pilimelia terevasa]GGK20750.1 DEAD/DEAH box helicase [Pilimelia terevasa]